MALSCTLRRTYANNVTSKRAHFCMLTSADGDGKNKIRPTWWLQWVNINYRSMTAASVFQATMYGPDHTQWDRDRPTAIDRFARRMQRLAAAFHAQSPLSSYSQSQTTYTPERRVISWRRDWIFSLQQARREPPQRSPENHYRAALLQPKGVGRGEGG